MTNGPLTRTASALDAQTAVKVTLGSATPSTALATPRSTAAQETPTSQTPTADATRELLAALVRLGLKTQGALSAIPKRNAAQALTTLPSSADLALAPTDGTPTPTASATPRRSAARIRPT